MAVIVLIVVAALVLLALTSWHGPLRAAQAAVCAHCVREYRLWKAWGWRTFLEEPPLTMRETLLRLRQDGLLWPQRLIFAIDFGLVNEVKGQRTFRGSSLHAIRPAGEGPRNPYERVLALFAALFDNGGAGLGAADAEEDEDIVEQADVHAYGFGDGMSGHDALSAFIRANPHTGYRRPCAGVQELVRRYRTVAQLVELDGPTSFAPAVQQAMRIVRDADYSMHTLVIVTGGELGNAHDSLLAITHASKLPLSILVIGVGDGPWDAMQEFVYKASKALNDHQRHMRLQSVLRFVELEKLERTTERTAAVADPGPHIMLKMLQHIPEQCREIGAKGLITPQHRPRHHIKVVRVEDPPNGGDDDGDDDDLDYDDGDDDDNDARPNDGEGGDGGDQFSHHRAGPRRRRRQTRAFHDDGEGMQQEEDADFHMEDGVIVIGDA